MNNLKLKNFELDTHDVACAAGFFNGEGSTSTQLKGTSPSTIQLSIGQSYLEMLHKCQEVFGVGRVYSFIDRGKVFHSWRVHDFENIQYVMCCMWPWLSQVKKDQYHKVCKNYLSQKGRRRIKAVHGTINMYKKGCRCEICGNSKYEYDRNYRYERKMDIR